MSIKNTTVRFEMKENTVCTAPMEWCSDTYVTVLIKCHSN